MVFINRIKDFKALYSIHNFKHYEKFKAVSCIMMEEKL